MRFMHTIMLAAASVALLTVSPVAMAQANFPSRPVIIVIPLAPGGGTETETRMYALRITENEGYNIVVENRPGAAGTIGAAQVARAAPDGHTLMQTILGNVLSPLAYPDLTYDPIRDFTPIVLMSKRALTLMVHPSLPVSSVAEYLAYAKANPDKVNFGTVGVGSIHHLIAARMHDIAGVKATYVHYKASQAKTVDLLAGRIDAMFSTFFTSAKNARSGKMKMIAVMNPERSPVAPDWATITEQGMPADVEYPGWLGIQSPARTPMPIVNKLNGALVKIVREPEVSKRFEADSVLVIGSTPEQFRQHIVKEIARWKSIAEKDGIKGEVD